MLQLINDNSTYKKINHNPLKLMKKDTCELLENNKNKDTIENFSSYHSRLKITYELEIDNTLPFLNLLIIKNKDGTLVTHWFKKTRILVNT